MRGSNPSWPLSLIGASNMFEKPIMAATRGLEIATRSPAVPDLFGMERNDRFCSNLSTLA